MMDYITIYTVTLPSVAAWPPGRVILKIAYTEKDALNYMESYPNIFVRPLLQVEKQTLNVNETD